MIKHFVVFAVLIAVVCSETVVVHKKHHKKHHHHKELYFYGLHYLAFLAIKVKIIFVIGSVFFFLLLGGKIFGFIKWLEYMKFTGHHVHHEPHYEHESFHHDSPIGYNSAIELDKLPPGAEIAGGGYSSYPPNGYQRSIENKNEGFYKHFFEFARIIRKLNITDAAFDSMKLNDEECKRKFVCHIEYKSRKSTILKYVLKMMSDDVYEKYKPAQVVKSASECDLLYAKCTTEPSQ